MTKVKISNKNNSLVVEWEDLKKQTYSHFLFSSFAKSSNNAEIISDSKFQFPDNKEIEREILEFLEDLKDQENDFVMEYDKSISKSVRDFEQEQKDFKNFSKLARDIRDNKNHDFGNVEGFEDSLKVLNRKLFLHQKLSAYHMAFSKNSCNFSVPGAGKTTVVYAVYNYFKRDNFVEKLIIVGPPSSSIAWQEEYEEVFNKKADILHLNGLTFSRDIDRLYSSSGPEIVHVTFNSFPKYIEEIRYFCTKYRTMMVVDEAHRIKNIDGHWSKAVLSTTESIDSSPVSRVILTGTPAPNSYEDFINLFKFIWPRHQIIQYPAGVLRQMSKDFYSPVNQRRIAQLTGDLAPYYIRVSKKDLGLPEIIINEPIVANPDPAQIKIYEYIRDEFKDKIRQLKNEKSEAFGLQLIRLRQAASNPSLLLKPVILDEIDYSGVNESYLEDIKEEIIEYDKAKISEKFYSLINKIKKLREEDRKVLVWCEFIDSCNKIKELLSKEGVNTAFLTGANINIEERKKIIDDFNDIKGKLEVVIATPLSVGESISLHKQCHDAIYFELSYNAGLHLQSMDRIHRLGLKPGTETNFWYILSNFPIEESVLKKIRKKEKRMRAIIESREIPLISDYRDLFSNQSEMFSLKELLEICNE